MAQYADQIAKLLDRHGSVPPLWAMFPGVHPYDICWRMGGGESYKHLFNEWWESLGWSAQERLTYVKRWDPPYSWLEWCAWVVWHAQYEDSELEVKPEHFCALEAAGLGSRHDWERTFGVDPEDYPVSGDESSRWLARPGPRPEF